MTESSRLNGKELEEAYIEFVSQSRSLLKDERTY